MYSLHTQGLLHSHISFLTKIILYHHQQENQICLTDFCSDEWGRERERQNFEWLSPLVNNQPWVYCVIWKLGDDPHSLKVVLSLIYVLLYENSHLIAIFWGLFTGLLSGGCAVAVVGRGVNIKGENLIVECKDGLIKHPMTSNACRKLAHLPFSTFPLYSR